MTKNIAIVAIPSIIVMALYLIVQLINLTIVGHMNDPAVIAGVGLGNLYINLSSQSIFMGLNYAIVTLVAQAYGNENYKLCGHYLNRGRIITTIAFVPMFILLFFCEDFLLAIG